MGKCSYKIEMRLLDTDNRLLYSKEGKRIMEEIEKLEQVLKDPYSLDIPASEMPEFGQSKTLDEYMIKVGALSAYACNSGQVYVHADTADDAEKPIRFMANTDPDKEVSIESTWILNRKNLSSVPLIKPECITGEPDKKYVVAYTSKNVMEKWPDKLIEPVVPIELMTLFYAVAGADEDKADGIVFNPGTEYEALMLKETCEIIFELLVSSIFNDEEEE